jgi:hypothetical protein
MGTRNHVPYSGSSDKAKKGTNKGLGSMQTAGNEAARICRGGSCRCSMIQSQKEKNAAFCMGKKFGSQEVNVKEELTNSKKRTMNRTRPRGMKEEEKPHPTPGRLPQHKSRTSPSPRRP